MKENRFRWFGHVLRREKMEEVKVVKRTNVES